MGAPLVAAVRFVQEAGGSIGEGREGVRGGRDGGRTVSQGAMARGGGAPAGAAGHASGPTKAVVMLRPMAGTATSTRRMAAAMSRAASSQISATWSPQRGGRASSDPTSKSGCAGQLLGSALHRQVPYCALRCRSRVAALHKNLEMTTQCLISHAGLRSHAPMR